MSKDGEHRATSSACHRLCLCEHVAVASDCEHLHSHLVRTCRNEGKAQEKNAEREESGQHSLRRRHNMELDKATSCRCSRYRECEKQSTTTNSGKAILNTSDVTHLNHMNDALQNE